MTAGTGSTARVFVYGTLMHGHANHRVLVELDARPVGEAMTAAPRTIVDLGPYPALLRADVARDASAARVAGEVYELDAAGVEVLDAFEGCPDLYARERIAVEHAGVLMDAWTYVLAEEVEDTSIDVLDKRR